MKNVFSNQESFLQKPERILLARDLITHCGSNNIKNIMSAEFYKIIYNLENLEYMLSFHPFTQEEINALGIRNDNNFDLELDSFRLFCNFLDGILKIDYLGNAASLFEYFTLHKKSISNSLE